MLEIKNIKKEYVTKYFKQMALNGVDLSFRTNEFVAILGPSGSGKTTLLNIIGGLDKYDEGDIIINGKSTQRFKDRDWDAYRNNCIGFVFQSYNLISHISVVANVEMAMTLSGVKPEIRHKKSMAALEKVGLTDHAFKTPNQLSGGQMQRVAIARALVNDPDIVLADEPTGALDSKTSVEIMNLIKEIAKEKLVIMVTHNRDIATEYASRVIEFKDGKVEKDSDQVKTGSEKSSNFNIKKTAMGYLSALRLSANNIRTKKWRTAITAFASSIGIIGIALILSLSNGLQKHIDSFERGTMSRMPIIVSSPAMNLDADTMMALQEQNASTADDYTNKEEVYALTSMMDQMSHPNNLSEDYLEYLNNIDEKLISATAFMRATNLNIITKIDGEYTPLGLGAFDFLSIPEKNGDDRWELINEFYDVISGRLPENQNELILMVDFKNRINEKVLQALGFSGKEEVSFEDLMKVELKLVANNEYYSKVSIPGVGTRYLPNNNYESMYSDSEQTLKIVGIIRGKEDKKLEVGSEQGLGFTESLMQFVYEQNRESDIVKAQERINYNIISGDQFTDDSSKQTILTYLGGNLIPNVIQIYPKDFDSKDVLLEYLDAYNIEKETEDKIIYTDAAAIISGMTGGLMSAVTYVLIGFSSISLIVSSIMIGIITYISVLERTKEIGILRALGARKKDITRVFNAETFIIGITSGLIGIGIAYVLTFPVNKIIYKITEINNVAKLNIIHALILIIVSMTLTLIGGFVPAKIASKKDPVEALRTE